jgi:anaphase-promoting complex subunit 10
LSEGNYNISINGGMQFLQSFAKHDLQCQKTGKPLGSILLFRTMRIDATLEGGNEKSGEREIGSSGTLWTLSSAKIGNGVQQLRDGNLTTFWQSDGIAPHWINVQFSKRTRISRIALYLDEKIDESYTPAKIAVKIGNSLHDLQQVQVVELEKPQGWISIPLSLPVTEEGGEDGEGVYFVKAFMLQIAVLASHQLGRDTHIRQVKIFGPTLHETSCLNSTPLRQFTTTEFSIHATLR